MQDNFITIKFADSIVPTFKQRRGEDYVRFGDDDKYPDYLLNLLNKSSKHNSIVQSKTTYIYGGGLKQELPDGAPEDPIALNFINKYDLLSKEIILDIEAFGMSYVQMIPTRGGKFNPYHLSFERCRANKKSSQIFYKEDWHDGQESRKQFPAFNPKSLVSSVLIIKESRPGNKVYALPGFVAACNFIEADIEVSKHILTKAQQGFSASKLITFYGGEPNEDAKRSIDSRFKNKHGGSQGDPMVIQFVQDRDKKTDIDDLGVSDLTKEDFAHVDQLIATNMYAGHRITNPALFGIPPDTRTLGGNAGAELKISYDIFKNTYVAEKKKQAEDIINFLAFHAGVKTKLTLIDTEPVGYTFTELSLLQVAPRSWVLEKLGIDPVKYPDAPAIASAKPASAAAAPSMHEAVNDNLKNLTAKQHAQLERILRQYRKGKLAKPTATLLLKNSLGLSDSDIETMLTDAMQAFSSEDAFGSDEDVVMLFEAHGEPSDGYQVYEKRLATFDKEYSDIEDKINVIRNKDPKSTAESIAKSLNVDVAVVKDYLKGTSGGATGIIGNIPKFEVRYSYELRSDVTGPAVLATTRIFCKKMLSLKRFYTRGDISKISQFLGYDVMKRAGGFWNNDGTIEYHCRHEFFSQIVIKKI